MKKLTGMIIIASLLIANTIPAYARPEYSEETKRLMREAGLQTEELEWEEIDRRQQEYRRRKGLSTSSNDELHINENYKQNVWHPEHRGYRINGFDEFRYPDEM